jgi:erythromycin esterase-like protein
MWLWRNAEMLDFLGWLRNFDDQFSGDAHKVRVCGVDLETRDKVVVWAHSREVGDARATDLGDTSLGQLARERHGRLAVLVNFSTYAGTYVAASGDGTAPRRYVLPAAPPDSIEAVCHTLEIPRFYLPLRDAPERLAAFLREPRLERMMSAVYQPDNALGRSVRARLVDQFDALVHFDETRSLEPIDPSSTTGS